MKNYMDPHLEKKTCQLHLTHCSLNQDLCAWWLLITVVRGHCVGMLDKSVGRKMLSGECDLTAFSSWTRLTSNWNRRMVCEFYSNASKFWFCCLTFCLCLIIQCLLSESDLLYLDHVIFWTSLKKKKNNIWPHDIWKLLVWRDCLVCLIQVASDKEIWKAWCDNHSSLSPYLTKAFTSFYKMQLEKLSHEGEMNRYCRTFRHLQKVHFEYVGYQPVCR